MASLPLGHHNPPPDHHHHHYHRHNVIDRAPPPPAAVNLSSAAAASNNMDTDKVSPLSTFPPFQDPRNPSYLSFITRSNPVASLRPRSSLLSRLEKLFPLRSDSLRVFIGVFASRIQRFSRVFERNSAFVKLLAVSF